MSAFDTESPKAMSAAGGLHLRIFDNLQEVKKLWLGLESTGVFTVFQSYEWCSTWFNRLGHIKHVTPCIVVAENQFGKVEFLLPLQCRKKLGLTIIEALTTPQAGYAFAVFNSSFLGARAQSWFSGHFDQLTAALPYHDVFLLVDIPKTLFGHANPFLGARSFVAANQTHILNLQPDFDALFKRRRSKDSRRSIHKRDAKLLALPGLQFDHPTNRTECVETLRVMFEHQEKRLAEAGIHKIFDADEREFFFDLAKAEGSQSIQLRPYRLSINGEIQSVILGFIRDNTFIALISSLAVSNFQRFSPGDYTLRMMIKALCEDHIDILDFSSGDSAYKYHWSDKQIPLHFIVRANSVKGVPYALGILIAEKLKRIGKTTSHLNTLLFQARKILRGKRI